MKSLIPILSFLLLNGVLLVAGEGYYVKLLQTPELECTILSSEPIRHFRGDSGNENGLRVLSRAAVAPPDDSMLKAIDESQIIEIFGKKKSIVEGHIEAICETQQKLTPLSTKEAKNPEVIQIENTGPKENRVDVVFMGDGYTEDERQNFIDDIIRLKEDMFNGVTFSSWLPLFNIWAIYVPSVESGIGYNGAKNTAFRLYRQAGQLRAVFTGNAVYARQVCQLTGASGCDYPSLIGNDDFYGGLGGEFVISTKSDRTGTVVLRHEMGHNFVNVGEEYDNGQVYRGVNAATTVANLGWAHWLTGARREERMMYRLLEYPWADLGAGERSYTFTSDGSYSSWYCLVSVSAAGEANSLEFRLDGQVLDWESSGHEDREFYSWRGEAGFSAGQHTFSVKSLTTPTHPDIPRMIASINIHEFGNADQFVGDNKHVSAYPTWDTLRRKTFRPTNAGCLMRNMTHTEFCDICKEGMWYEFLRRISLIDGVTVENNEAGIPVATLATLRLGHLRAENNIIPGEELTTRWYLENSEFTSYRDRFEAENPPPGNWRIDVRLFSPEILNDPQGLTFDSITFTV